MVYGNGSGNGGDRVEISNRDIENLRINLSTEGLRPEVWVRERSRPINCSLVGYTTS